MIINYAEKKIDETFFLLANLPDYNYMGKGWSFLSRKIDDYDVEWQTWKSIITKYWYLLVIHSTSAEIFRYLKLKVRKFLKSYLRIIIN